MWRKKKLKQTLEKPSIKTIEQPNYSFPQAEIKAIKRNWLDLTSDKLKLRNKNVKHCRFTLITQATLMACITDINTSDSFRKRSFVFKVSVDS